MHRLVVIRESTQGRSVIRPTTIRPRVLVMAEIEKVFLIAGKREILQSFDYDYKTLKLTIVINIRPFKTKFLNLLTFSLVVSQERNGGDL